MSGNVRLLEERQLPVEVILMKWSPKMDLLAIANKKGEVALHRLTWQRVWLLGPQENCESVSNLCWRPDGKVLAICYKDSKVFYLVDIENKNILHEVKHEIKANVTCLSWLPLDNSLLLAESFDNLNLSSRYQTSPTGDYLPPLPSLNRGFNLEPERKDFLYQTLDMLFVGNDEGEVMMYIFGMFYCGTIKIGNGMVLDIVGGSGKPIWVSCKRDLGMTVNRLSCSLLESSVAFLKIAQIQANIECLMDYLSSTLMAISEAWETILLEMDEKLARYEEPNEPGTLAADFLEFLMIGIPTSKLETFLLRDLTDKGLKKLGHSIEICYNNIQKLVLKHLSSVGMALVYQLSQMIGMARLGGHYELLGLKNETPILNALHAAEAFLAKSSEIQQVIDHSMRDYKAFFRWLYVVIARLTDERIPSEASKISQQELTYIAEFLLGFDKTDNASNNSSCSDGGGGSSSSRRKGVNLEKLGQYLRREPLQIPLTPDGSEWATMLNENKCLHDHPLIIKQDLDLSLVLSHEKLVSSIEQVFLESYQDLVKHFSISSTNLTPFPVTVSSHIVTNDGNLLVTATDNEHKLLRIFNIEFDDDKNTDEIQNSCLIFKQIIINFDNSQASFSKTSLDYLIVDLQFYSLDYISLLLYNQTNSATCFLQLPINHNELFQSNNDDTININDIIGSNWPKPFYEMPAGKIVVSGQRKVAAVLSENSRKIKLLETEVEPDDEEDDDEDSLMETSANAAPETSIV